MAIEVVVPRLGWSMDEGTFSEWLKQDGQWVDKGEMLFVLEGEKAAQEIESFDEGILRISPDGPKPGETVKVGQVIGFLLAKGEAAPPSHVRSEEPRGTSERPVAGPAVRRLARQMGVDLGQVAGSGPGGRITTTDVQLNASLATTAPSTGPIAVANHTTEMHRSRPTTPRARRVARDLGIELSALTGSGRGGRIRERDVRAWAARQPSNGRRQAIRQAIAARMMASFHGTAPVTLTSRADATDLEAWRAARKAAAKADDVVPSITDLLIRLSAVALAKHPYMNSRWEGDQVLEIPEIHLGFAVDTDAGLLVPVLPNVGSWPLSQIARSTRELAQRARSGQLTMQQMQGGTFTITNLGMFGIDAFTPIIHAPETGILGVGAIRRELVVSADDRFAVRSIMTLSLTFDHRAMDGAPAARFLQTLCQLIEQPATWLDHEGSAAK